LNGRLFSVIKSNIYEKPVMKTQDNNRYPDKWFVAKNLWYFSNSWRAYRGNVKL